ncbi:hypothetical protein B0T17DRAFT_103140 [Bombardia bombarda]|uniref:Uncharacterized protein n=1 Tax=Bombardia bombarda TaxID=252184 RepID=A0AA39XND8_9PEZI|nr:hypothetical protein B0T17DRAFT_103140 [Bombardia bombarda]
MKNCSIETYLPIPPIPTVSNHHQAPGRHGNGMSKSTEPTTIGVEDPISPAGLLSPDPDVQRGRKRRRELAKVGGTSQVPSGESATLRGRCRNRSTSVVTLSIYSSRNASRSGRDTSHSPSRKHILRLIHVVHRRSQSPSRSRSLNAKAPSRRRQRTTSRSRNHLDRSASVADIKTWARPKMAVDDHKERGKE